MIFFGSSIIECACKSQSVVAPSSQASELIQMFVASKKIVWIKAMIAEIDLTPANYIVPIASDSKAALASINVITAKSKHLGVYVAYLRMLKENRLISFHKIARDINPADLMTKQDN